MGKKIPAATVEKPPALDAFVRGGRPDRAGRLGAQAPDTRGKIRVDGDGKERDRVHAWVLVETKRKLAIYCASHGREMGDVVDEALTEYMRAHKKGE